MSAEKFLLDESGRVPTVAPATAPARSPTVEPARAQEQAAACPRIERRTPLVADLMRDMLGSSKSLLVTLSFLCIFACYGEISVSTALVACLLMYYIHRNYELGYRFVAGAAIGCMFVAALCAVAVEAEAMDRVKH